MPAVNLYPHQSDALNATKQFNHVAYYHDMGLGKTYTGSEKAVELGAPLLLICQKSKIEDWVTHLVDISEYDTYDLSDKKEMTYFLEVMRGDKEIANMTAGVINYELAFRRPELESLRDFTLMLDESSMIQNERSKRARFILGLKPKNVILLSGTPVGGRWERLWSQLRLLGYSASKTTFWNQYVDYSVDRSQGFPLIKIKGYKNEERLKDKMRSLGCHFLKTDEVFDLPEQVHQTIRIPAIPEYKRFRKSGIVNLRIKADNNETTSVELVGDTTLTKMLYERMLCGQYNTLKLDAYADILVSTNDRLIVFYNFTEELRQLIRLTDRPISIVNGDTKDLSAYETENNSVTFAQYQSAAMGLNLQKANKIVYFTPPLSSELFEQSKKRTHRINQTRACFYYYLTVTGSVETKIYRMLAMRRDYTNALFEKGE